MVPRRAAMRVRLFQAGIECPRTRVRWGPVGKRLTEEVLSSEGASDAGEPGTVVASA